MKKEALLIEISNRISKISDVRKQKIISSILKNNTWYLDLDIDTVISILLDLEFDKIDAIEVYKSLLT